MCACSGVELCGELHDFVQQDLSTCFPNQAKHVKVTLIEAMPSILAMFDKDLVQYAEERLTNVGVDVKTQTMVTGVGEECVHIKDGEDIPYGALVWVAGITTRPITSTSKWVVHFYLYDAELICVPYLVFDYTLL